MSMKQQIDRQKLDKIYSSRNLGHFLNRLNKDLFGNSFRRFGKKVEVVPIFETSISGRLHYHLAMKNPKPDYPMLFGLKIRQHWLKTPWGYNEIDINHNINNGWIDYITKTKGDDYIDWANYHKIVE